MMYLFIHFMDEMLVAEDPVPNKGYPFSSIYFQKTSQQIGFFLTQPNIFFHNGNNNNNNNNNKEFQTFQPDILIREISVSPSHFNLMVNKKSWAVAPVTFLFFSFFSFFFFLFSNFQINY